MYFDAHRRRWQFALASLLLALTVLANFFNAVTAAVFVAVTIVYDAVRRYRASDQESQTEARRALIAHLITPLVAICLTLFWLVPMISDYDYFVTRPHTASVNELVPPVMWAWYALSAIGILLWLRRPTRAMWPFLTTLFTLTACVIFATGVAPRWFPFQTTRFLSTLNFLLAVPIGQVVLVAQRGLKAAIGGGTLRAQLLSNRLKTPQEISMFFRALIVAGAGIVLLVSGLMLIKPMSPALTFYPTTEAERIDSVLRFAKEHRDGRYLVEVPHFSYPEAAHDARALNSYLGT